MRLGKAIFMARKSILVVDDERNQREILETILSGEGYDVTTASSGEAAMKFVLETSKKSEGKALIERIKHMIARNEYKRRQSPPILRVRTRAFGSGRQMPIAQRWRR